MSLKSFSRLGRFLVVILLIAAVALGALSWWWVHKPLELSSDVLEVSIESGQTPRDVAREWVQAGVQTSPWVLYQWFRWSGKSKLIRAGSYELNRGSTPADLLRMLVRGDARLATVKLIEGWTFKRFKQELAQADGLKSTIGDMSDDAVMLALGAPGTSAEGHFFPDTYSYAKGSLDIDVLRRAWRAMNHHLEEAWAEREPNTPLKSPEEALILASIIEKETGHEADRAMISGVFNNRLRLGMPLQTDPSVIYGLGDRFDGNLRKIDLQTDTPFNTYTRRGLPPTPISMPGKAALLAAVRPAPTQAIYFVARGDGTSAFSNSLTEHNRAVNQYQRKRP